jgi:hypothetical protein
MNLGSASTIFGMMLAGSGLFATLLGGLTANTLRRRTPAGYTCVLAFSLVMATPVCFFALIVGNVTLSLVGLGVSMFLLFLPMGPIASEMFEIVPVHLRASAMALCTFIIHLFGDFGSPTIVGTISTNAGDNLRTGVMILPFVLMVGAVLWCTLVAYTRKPLEVQA